mgnify:CR=1 FL=1
MTRIKSEGLFSNFKRDLVLTQKFKLNSKSVVLGLVLVKKGKDLIYDYKADKREVKIAIPFDWNENKDFSESQKQEILKRFKKSKKCSHSLKRTEVLSMRYERMKHVSYCEHCGKVSSIIIVDSENTQTLINIKFAEGRLYEKKEEIKSANEKIKRLKLNLEKDEIEIENMRKTLK